MKTRAQVYNEQHGVKVDTDSQGKSHAELEYPHYHALQINPSYRVECAIMELETLLEPAHYQEPDAPESQGKPPKLVYHGRMRDLKDELDQTKAQVLHLQKKLSERKPRQEPSGF